MIDIDAAQSLLLVAVFLVAGGVKGITGMGLPTVAVSLLGLWLPPGQAAALLVLPSLATNLAQCRGPHLRSLTVTLWPAWLAMALLTLVAPGLGDQAPTFDARRWLGLVLVVYGAWGLWRPALPDWSGRSNAAGVVAGAATGLITAMTAVFVIPLVPYLQALRLDKDALVQALGLSFTVATLALALRLQTSGAATPATAPLLLSLGAAFAGLWLGSALRARLSAALFQRALFLVLIGLGLANLARGS